MSTIKGQISFVEMLRRYKMCSNPKCSKKLPASTAKWVKCLNCNGGHKLAFAQDGFLVKFIFVDKDKKKTSFTMFQQMLKIVVPDYEKLSNGLDVVWMLKYIDTLRFLCTQTVT